MNKIQKFYADQSKKLLAFALLLVVLAATTLIVHKVQTGNFVEKGISLTGGVSLRADVTPEFAEEQFIQSLSTQFPTADSNIRELTEDGVRTQIIVEVSGVSALELEEFTKAQEGVIGTEEVREFGAAISEAFFRQTVFAVILALIFMAIVVYITFRNVIPSLFVVLAAVSTLITTLAVTVLINMKLSSAGIAALLMLIGYSVDTDILLTTRVLKRQEGGSLLEKIFNAMRTGVTMTLSSFFAVLVAFIFTNSEIIAQVMLILSIGLFFDLIYTWLQNAIILKLYMESKHEE